MTAQFEENPVFAETPTSIFGATAEFPLANGSIELHRDLADAEHNFQSAAARIRAGGIARRWCHGACSASMRRR